MPCQRGESEGSCASCDHTAWRSRISRQPCNLARCSALTSASSGAASGSGTSSFCISRRCKVPIVSPDAVLSPPTCRMRSCRFSTVVSAPCPLTWERMPAKDVDVFGGGTERERR